MIQNKDNKTLLKIGLLFGVALIITSFTIPYVSGVTIDYTAWEKKTRSEKYDVIVETLKDIFYQFNEVNDVPDEGGVKFPISFELDMWRYNGGSRTLFLPPGVFYYRQYFVPSKVKFSIFVVNKDTPLDVASLRNIFEFKRIGVGSDVSGASTTWSYTIGGNAGFSGKELNLGASAQISWTTSYSKGVKGQPDTKNEYEFIDAYHYEIVDWFLYWPIIELKVERKGIHLVSWEYDFYEQGGHSQMALSGAFEIAIANSYAHLQKFDNFEFIIKITIEYQKYERMEWPIKLFFTKLNDKKSYSMTFRLGDGKGDFDSTIYMLQTKIFKE